MPRTASVPGAAPEPCLSSAVDASCVVSLRGWDLTARHPVATLLVVGMMVLGVMPDVSSGD